MSADTLEQQFVQWWPYPVPPNKQSITWAVAWAEHVLQRQGAPAARWPAGDLLDLDAVAPLGKATPLEVTRRSLLAGVLGSPSLGPLDCAAQVLQDLGDALHAHGHHSAAAFLLDSAAQDNPLLHLKPLGRPPLSPLPHCGGGPFPSATPTLAMATDPLWLRLRNHPSLFCLHMHPAQAAVILRQVVAEVYNKDMWDWGEVAEWLEEQATIADAAAERSNA